MFGKYYPDLTREKKGQVIDCMRELDIDAWLILTREGSDAAMPLVAGGKTVGMASFLFTSDGRLTAVVANYDAGHVELFGGVDEIIPYKLGITEELVKLYKKVAPAKLALDYSTTDILCDGLTHGQYLWLESALGEQELRRTAISSEPLLSRVRAIKTPIEQSYVREAVRRTNDVFDAVFSSVRAGMTERDVQQLFLAKVSELGYDEGEDGGGASACIARVGMAHRGPTDAIIEPGDSIVCDGHCTVNGYTSDICRSAYFLRPGETEPATDVARAFVTIRDAITKAFSTLKPGLAGWEVDAVARDHLVSKGYPEISHALGHQIGRYGHDGGTILGPRWERYGKAPYGVVEPGMLFTLEPTVIIPGGVNMCVEEDVLVTEDGAQWLSRREMELITVG